MTISIQKQPKPYGSWPSKLTPEVVAQAGTKISGVYYYQGQVYWTESRPAESGRQTLCRKNEVGQIIELLPGGFSIKSRVHEYGGGALCLVGQDEFIFCNDDDQRLYRVSPNAAPVAVTAKPEQKRGERYTDLLLHPDQTGLVGVRERHVDAKVINELFWLDLDSGAVSVLESSHDFYMAPQVAPCGKRIAWISWDQPNMPWDHTQLWIADLVGGQLANKIQVDAEFEHSVLQPSWDNQGRLLFCSDQSGWWNIYRYDQGVLQALTPSDIEFGFPHWIFGMQAYHLLDDEHLVAIGYQKGLQQLYLVEMETGHMRPLNTPFNCFHYSLQGVGDEVILLASSASESPACYSYCLASEQLKTIHSIEGAPLLAGDIAVAEAIEFPTTNQDTAHAFFYEPTNTAFEGVDGELPPAIVMSHGGPSGQTDADFNPQIQFWTNRGFAVIDVNYRGSTGYGRDYRNKLRGNWGIYDVDDCIAAVDYLAFQGCIDKTRVAIRGGSAGGYTTLQALTKQTQPFSAGVSRYGVSDLEALASDSHKFEARYLDLLVGKYPKDKAIYLERSPLHNIANLKTPMLLLQGLEDKVVPPNQAEKMVQALQKKGLAYAYITFADEAHGFKKAENVVVALDAEWQFYCQIWEIDYQTSNKLTINNLV